MNKPVKEIVVSSGDELKVFVRPSLQELGKDDLEIVAGGRRAMWDPNG